MALQQEKERYWGIKMEKNHKRHIFIYRQGYKEDKVGRSCWKREPKMKIRCGCEMNYRVHIKINGGT